MVLKSFCLISLFVCGALAFPDPIPHPESEGLDVAAAAEPKEAAPVVAALDDDTDRVKRQMYDSESSEEDGYYRGYNPNMSLGRARQRWWEWECTKRGYGMPSSRRWAGISKNYLGGR